MIKRFFALWKAIAVVALFAILITFLVEFFLHPTEEQRHWLELIDLVAVAVLAVELAIHYIEAKTKKHFFRKNWLLIISLFPLGSFLRALNAVKAIGKIIASYLSKGFHLLTHSTKFMRAYRLVAVWSKKGKRKGKSRGKKR